MSSIKPKFLIVDDDSSNRIVLKKMLEHIALIDLASSGSEAVDFFSKAINEKTKYDVIFLDIMMPEMNGQEVLTQIRNLEKSNYIIPGEGAKVIIITGLDNETAAFESHVLGCEAYLMKPFSRTQVQEKLLELGFWTDK